MSNNLQQSNILLCGSPRVGKSTLINAICQQQLAKTNTSLNSLTNKIDRYSYQSSNGRTNHETVIWDTPGIESWNENDVRTYIKSLIEQTQPLCMIYCASPGSFALLNHVAWIVEECYRLNIFCALVCTNMWAGRNRQEVVDEFCRLLTIVHPHIQPNKEDNIIYYDNLALVTMVNSQEYIDKDFDVTKSPSGIEELIFGIGKCLNRDLMFAWFRTVSQNSSFWSKMSSKLTTLFKIPQETLNSLYEHAATVIDFLFDVSIFSDEGNMAITPHGISLTTQEKVISIISKIISRQWIIYFHFRKNLYFIMQNLLICLNKRITRN
jgi:GTPase SAR1 family protein